MKYLLIDLDGTLYQGESPIPQAKGFMESVQKAGVPVEKLCENLLEVTMA